ncbi:hypothetical protein ACJDT4_16965 [Clostridium neuense]|uniref:YcxB-like protein domain-containing protein n=1 Tax=Clostridium neuense TaxID=1728934 RepID=A0ABW8TKU8_9CLOT
MEINYTISKEELVNFHLKHFTETKSYKHTAIMQIISMLVLTILTYILFNRLYYCIIVLLAWFVLALSKRKRIRFLLKKKLNKIFLSAKYKDYFEPTKLTITESGLQTSTSLSEKTYKWQSIKIISLVDTYIFIITAANDELLIPIRTFKNYEDKESFLNNLIKKTNLKLSYTYPIDTKK